MAAGNIKIQSNDTRIYTLTPEDGAVGNVDLTIPKEGGKLAADSLVVHKTGDETIAGVKNFTSTPTVNGNVVANDNAVAHKTGDETISGTKTFSNTIIGNISGTATKLTNSSNDWQSSGAIANVVGMLAWKNYGNGHVIFDASNGTAPNGAAVNNSNAQSPWTPNYPTLMGWNGSNTFGVRVDSARVADSATKLTTAITINGVAFDGTGNITVLPPAATSTTYGGIKASLSGTTLTITL